MKTNLFVDGYNIIGDWEELVKLKDVDFEGARKKLIDELSEFQAISHYKIILVFDGHLVKDSRGSRETVGGIDTIYTQEGVTADMVIERLVANLPKYHKTYVATSDRLEQETVLARGALRISARELKILIAEAKETLKTDESIKTPKLRRERNTFDLHLSEADRLALKKLME